MLPVIMGHTPGGASTDQVFHYAQGIRSGRFRQFDFGALNLFHHGSLTPPVYNLGNVNAPVSMYYSLNDLLAEPVDVYQLWNGLRNPVNLVRIADPRFNHFDFVWAIDARPLLYNRVLSIMQNSERGFTHASEGDLSEDINNLKF